MNKSVKNFAFLFLIMFSLGGLFAANEAVVLNSLFLKKLGGLREIERDHYLEATVGRNVSGKGRIVSVQKSKRFNRKYQVIVELSNKEYGNSLRSYLYTDNSSFTDEHVLRKNIIFTGRLLLVTPLNSRRTRYFCEIILEKGTINIE